MRSKQRNDHGRVDEDYEVGDDHEGWALNLTPLHVSAALFAARQIVTTLEEYTRYDRKSGCKAGERVRYGHGEAVGAGCCATERVSQRRRSITTSLPCHGSRKDEVDDADECHDLFPGVAGHLGRVIPSDCGVRAVDQRKVLCEKMRRQLKKDRREGTRYKSNNVSVSVVV